MVKETPSPSGYTQSIVASGLLEPTGVAVDGSGNVYIADTGDNQVLMETLSSGSYMPTVVASSLSSPAGVAVDTAGNVYVADTQNNRVLKETPSSGSYSQSLIGSDWNGPTGIAVDAAGNVYVSDQNTRVMKETPSSGSYTEKLLYGVFSKYNGLAVDAAGTVYIADVLNHRVDKVTSNGYQSIVPAMGLGTLWGVAVDPAGNVYVADSSNNQIAELMGTPNFGTVNVGTPSAKLSVLFGFQAGGSIATPSVLTKGVSNLDYADAGTGTCTTNGPMYVYSSGGTCSVDVVLTPRAPGHRAGAVTLTSSNGTRISSVFLTGTGVGPQVSFQPGTQSTIPFPNGSSIAIDGAGNIFMSQAYSTNDPRNDLIEETWNGNGYTQTVIATGFNYSVQIALDSAGDIFVADQDNQTVYEEVPNSSGGYTQSKPFGSLGVVGSEYVCAR